MKFDNGWINVQWEMTDLVVMEAARMAAIASKAENNVLQTILLENSPNPMWMKLKTCRKVFMNSNWCARYSIKGHTGHYFWRTENEYCISWFSGGLLFSESHLWDIKHDHRDESFHRQKHKTAISLKNTIESQWDSGIKQHRCRCKYSEFEDMSKFCVGCWFTSNRVSLWSQRFSHYQECDRNSERQVWRTDFQSWISRNRYSVTKGDHWSWYIDCSRLTSMHRAWMHYVWGEGDLLSPYVIKTDIWSY